MSAFVAALDQVKVGDLVTAQVWRGGKVVQLQAVVRAP